MIRHFTWLRSPLWVAFALILAVAAHAFEVPPSTGHVVDQAGVIPEGVRTSLESALRRIARERSLQVAVLTVTTLDNESPESAAQKVFDAWKMGRKGEDRGLLFLVATQDRKVRIQPGYGLEGELPDGKVGRILDETVLPRFKTGDWAGGIVAGLDASLTAAGVTMGAIAAGVPAVTRPVRRDPREISPLGALASVIGLVLVIIGCAISPTFRFLILNMLIQGSGRGGRNGGDDSGGGFGGFGGGSSGGGGASRSW